MPFKRRLVLFFVFLIPVLLKGGVSIENPIFGSWAFNLPDGNPVWLSVKEDTTALLLWSVGSAKPASVNSLTKDMIAIKAELGWRPYGLQTWYRITKSITGRLNSSGVLELQVFYESENENGEFTLYGKKMPPIPPKPNLSKIQYGQAINLLENGIESWELTNTQKINGWRFHEGELINETPKTDFGAYGSYGNLRTIDTFEDFELLVDYNVAPGGNSGIYLRGAYEVQIVDRDSPMQGIQGPGAIFGRITPSINNANPGGKWNSLSITLVDRHITVELNGVVVIDNQPIEGCTGGGINSDDTKPGPIFLQGDHTSVKYRNMILRKVIK